MADLFADVSLPLPIEGTFTYRVPEAMSDDIMAGARVLVPFRRRAMTGFVVDLSGASTIDHVKSVLELRDRTPLIDARMLELCRWISSYYFCPLGMVLKSALPAGLLRKGKTRVSLLDGAASLRDLNPAMTTILTILSEKSPITADYLRKRVGITRGAMGRALASLEDMGVVALEEYLGGERVREKKHKVVKALEWDGTGAPEFGRSTRQRECYEYLLGLDDAIAVSTLRKNSGFGASVVEGLRSKGLASVENVEELRTVSTKSMSLFGEGWENFVPEADQIEALEAIERAIEMEKKEVFLLHGVSGSGKTVVYIEAIKKALTSGRGAILLVPEIALTTQTVSRISSAIDQPVALFHSALSAGERFDAWRKVRDGDYRVVVGARSAIFLPVKDLGLIVIDEEHETTYKQEETPRYHAREVAVRRAEMTDATVILGSATPSLESFWKAGSGAYRYIELSRRYRSRPTPDITIVDMREEPRWKDSWFISDTLGEKLVERIEKAEQSILFLNRRGHSTFLQCPLCGWVAGCHQCEISLTYHRFENALICHYCSHVERIPDACPSCSGMRLRLRGLGTEQVEEEIKKSLPDVRIARMDMDSTSLKGSHERILRRLLDGEVDILLGTQMVTKGLDFPGITLVGVVNSDASIHLPDLRSAERTFQLLAQVSGRSGREGGGGEVVLQTFLPENKVLRCVEGLDYGAFATDELAERKDAHYPPFYHLFNVTASGRAKEKVVDIVTAAAGAVRDAVTLEIESGDTAVVGPAPCLVERIKGEYRWHFLFKVKQDVNPGPFVRVLKEKTKKASRRDVTLVIDRDPISFF